MATYEYERLSKNQKELVKDILSDKSTRRKRVLGNAGSGKTTIIAICANKLAQEGKKVMICCYNKSLLWYIEHLANKGSLELELQIEIDNYHHFMWHYIEESDRQVFKNEEYDNYPVNTTGYRLPPYYKKSLFDYIFVDEMQDLKPNAIANLIDLLKENGKICVFADKYQRLYEHNKYEKEEENLASHVPKFPPNLGFKGKWTRLNEVFRANNLIQDKGLEFAKKELFFTYGVENSILSGERTESEIMYINRFSLEDIANYISKMKNIEQKNTVVLFDEIYDIDKFEKVLNAKQIRYISVNASKINFNLKDKGIKLSTVKSFKGMELPICIYVCNHKIQSCEDYYVAVTRATKKLVVCNANVNNPLHNIYSEYTTELFS